MLHNFLNQGEDYDFNDFGRGSGLEEGNGVVEEGNGEADRVREGSAPGTATGRRKQLEVVQRALFFRAALGNDH